MKNEYKQAEGNLSLLVLVNSLHREDYLELDEIIFSALNHFGMPYEIMDLEQDRLSGHTANSHSCIMLAQENLGKRSSTGENEVIAEAVKEGVGLVSFDSRVDLYSAELAKVFMLASHSSPGEIKEITVSRNNQYITGTREKGESIGFLKPLGISKVETSGAPEVLLSTIDGFPVLLAGKYGEGRVVQFLLSSKVWLDDYLGHAEGMDDFFWKSLVWAAKKPFLMQAMPPFVATLFDDCSSSYNHFGYLDIFNNHNYIPHLELYLHDIDKITHYGGNDDSKVIKAKYDEGLAEFAAHGFTYNFQIYYDHQNKKPYSKKQMDKHFTMFDEKFSGWGIKPSKYLNAHFGEVGFNALPYLKDRGIIFLGGHSLNEPWLLESSERREWNPKPYGHTGFILDCMPDYPDFFAAKAMVGRRMLTSAPNELGDCLWGNTIFWDENTFNDMEGAAKQACMQIKRGLDSLFFGYLMTHEQRIAVLSRKELDNMLTLVDRYMAKYDIIYKSLGYAAQYGKNIYNSHIAAANGNRGKATCTLRGKTDMTTSIYFFTGKDDQLEYKFIDVPPFTGQTTVSSEVKL
jgi:hypothetical protein